MYLEAGVTRISLGVQSFDDGELLRLGRTHTSGKAVQAVHEIRTAGVRNLSLDLMFWLPGQSLTSWQATVHRTDRLSIPTTRPSTCSSYIQTRHFARTMARAEWSQVPDDDAADMTCGLERLDRAGFVQYEISNVSRGGAVSRHNLKYWQDGAWLGFGCGAHSTRGGSERRKVSGTEDYIQRVRAGRTWKRSARCARQSSVLEEALFTGLRLTDGIDLDATGRRYGVDAWARFGDALAPHIDAGRAVRDGGRLRLTRDGMLVANDVMVAFV